MARELHYYIELEPSQRVLQLSRSLPGMCKWDKGKLYVRKNADNAAVMLEMMPELRQENLPFLIEYEKQTGALGRMREEKLFPPEAGAFEFKTAPYAHQMQAFARMKHAEYFGLFCEMGTGKTKMLIDNAFSMFNEGAIKRVFVLAPNGVHAQWADEQIPMHASHDNWDARVYYNGMGVRWVRDWEAFVKANDFKLRFYLMAATALASKNAVAYMNAIVRTEKTMLILDESHLFMNWGSKRTENVLAIAPEAAVRRISTGTPIGVGLENLYPQMNFLHPMVFGDESYTAFKGKYCVTRSLPGVNQEMIVGYKNVPALRDRLEPVTMQVLKKDCLDLPPKIYMRREVELTPEQRKAYESMRDNLVVELNESVVEVEHALVSLTKLQQILCGFMYDNENVLHEIKSNRITSAVEAARESGSGIIWARFRYDIMELEKALSKEGFRVGTYFGDTPEEERQRLRKPGEVDWLVANPASAGTGLNLTHFNTAIYYSNSFNAIERWQSEDRIHRAGQTSPCTYVDLYVPGTIDDAITRSLGRKKEVSDMIIDRVEALVEDVEDVKKML